MQFKDYSRVKNIHAFLGASNYHWINYDDNKLMHTYNNWKAAQRGSEIHEFAETCIKLGQKLPKSDRTLNRYVNDAIGYRMTPEQMLFYSENCFGTADTISFKKNLLRIHDLKTGAFPAKMEQLLVYSALFCLDYDIRPGDIDYELRIYQNDDVNILKPEVDDVNMIKQKIVHFDKILKEMQEKEK